MPTSAWFIVGSYACIYLCISFLLNFSDSYCSITQLNGTFCCDLFRVDKVNASYAGYPDNDCKAIATYTCVCINWHDMCVIRGRIQVNATFSIHNQQTGKHVEQIFHTLSKLFIIIMSRIYNCIRLFRKISMIMQLLKYSGTVS